MDSNFWRGIIFCQAGLVFAMTIAVIIRYSLALALTQNKDRVLPYHVLAISTSYLLSTIFIVLEIHARWNEPLTYRTPLAGAIFILGDAALIFMLMHMAVQRQYIGHIRDYVEEKSKQEKDDLAKELLHQTSGLSDQIKEIGDKAEHAYHAANNVNEKIAHLQSEAAVVALAANEQHTEEIREINQTGKDTNARVRRIEPQVVKDQKNEPIKPAS